MYLNNITVEAEDSSDEEVAEILEGLNFLCNTVAGTYPMNREFGIDASIFDKPLPVAKQLLSIELRDVIAKFEKRVEVVDISFSKDDTADEKILTRITVKLSDYQDEEFDNIDYDEDDV